MEIPDRVPCPNCGAANFRSSTVCWQCGQPLVPEASPRDDSGAASPELLSSLSQPCGDVGVPRPDTYPYVLLGFILAALALLCCCCPPLFAIPSIVLGAIAYSRGDRRGLWVIIAGTFALFGGVLISLFGHSFQRQWVPDFAPAPWRRV